jgi:RNA recognition motif-containing protein
MNQASNRKLYVGSLPFSTTEEELNDLFAQFGPVSSARIVADKFTGMSKGFGFVEMESADDARKAIDALNGKPFNGRTLIVNDARPEQQRTGGGPRRDDRGGPGGSRGGFNRGGGDRPFRSRNEH